MLRFRNFHPSTLFLPGALCLVSGCFGHQLGPIKDPVERAKKIKELREEADYEFQIFVQSEGRDLEALQRYAERLRETTIVSPTDCPLCYSNYGQALGRLGLYYEDLAELFKKELETAAPGDREEIQGKIKKYQDMARDHYARANRQFDSYFAGTSEASVHPDAYRWVFQMSAAQGDFSRARHFLDLYSKSVRLTEEQKLQLAALKKSYEQGQRLLDEKELERAFHEGGDESGFDGEPARNPRGR